MTKFKVNKARYTAIQLRMVWAGAIRKKPAHNSEMLQRDDGRMDGRTDGRTDKWTNTQQDAELFVRN